MLNFINLIKCWFNFHAKENSVFYIETTGTQVLHVKCQRCGIELSEQRFQ